MPLYEYECACGVRETAFRHVDERNEAPQHCGKDMARIISPAMVRPDITPYQSPIDGRAITSRKQRIEDLKRNGCRPWEGMEAEKAHAETQRKHEEAKSDEKLRRNVANVLNNMDAEKQRALTQ